MPERLRSLSFFFPAYNEEGAVRAATEQALQILPRFADDLEVTIVDDGSRDATGRIADELAAAHANVRVIHHGRNRGYGAAVRTGLASATNAFVFYADGDLQFDLSDFQRLAAAMNDGVGAVVGYRIKRADPLRPRFVSAVYNFLIRVLFAGGWRDVDCGFKLFRSDVFERVPLDRVRSNGAFFSPELLLVLRAGGIRIVEVGVPHHPRTTGEPKGSTPKVILRAIRDLLRLRLRLWFKA